MTSKQQAIVNEIRKIADLMEEQFKGESKPAEAPRDIIKDMGYFLNQVTTSYRRGRVFVYYKLPDNFIFHVVGGTVCIDIMMFQYYWNMKMDYYIREIEIRDGLFKYFGASAMWKLNHDEIKGIYNLEENA